MRGRGNASDSAQPRYRRIAAALIRNIEAGLYPDRRLPGRRVLESQFGASRVTIDSALDILERERWIRRIPSKRVEITVRREDFGEKLTSFLSRSGFRPPRMNDAFRRADERRLAGGAAEQDVINLSKLCDEHWDGHLNFDLEAAAVAAAMRDYRAGVSEMFTTGGMPGLKAALCEHLPSIGIHANPAEILILSRRLQAYRLVSEVLIGPSTEFWYPAVSLIRFYGIAERHTSWRREMPVDASGRIDFSGFEVSKRPKVLALEPDAAKPLGGTLSEAERLMLVDAARKTSAFIIEDCYTRIVEPTATKPPLASLDPGKDCVIYMGAVPAWFSTIGCFNFVVANDRLISQLRASGRRDYLSPGLFSQYVAEKLFTEHLIEPMTERFAVFHRERIAAVNAILAKYLGDRFSWKCPAGFGCIWLDLAGVNLKRLWRRRRGVDFELGWFYGEKELRHVLLRYTIPLGKFEEGVKRLRENIEAFG
ncbi:GntR family transcriptional regulator [Sutterella sp.]|uniref:GntR family transcriptional regulator n=1 Tax=Sutterella sp. TaxID=1981025 RepID=UPI0026DFB4C7|nr:GntR family transcriptional regulator [Sutterella sp.]MDO5532198.1 GntR family transcriptional regulator [Sutterella sp.]